jgi:SAM-dependent methyltransferase
VTEPPAVGRFRFGDFRRLIPVSREWGFDRGLPVDRYYIERFLDRCRGDIRGRVLEIGDRTYTERYGGKAVTHSDVLHVTAENPLATIIGDLTHAPELPSHTFDCAIITQTLHLIYDFKAAIATLHRILKPGGVLLLTVPYINQLQQGEWGSTWHWGFTELSARRAFGERFPPDRVAVESHGNVLAAISFLEGLAAQELCPDELDYHDPLYQLLITVRAVKETAPA